MASDDNVSSEFMDALKDYHNPDTIFKLAKTDFERATAIEFFFITKRLDIQAEKLKHLNWMIIAVFGVIVLEFISKLFGV